MTAMTNDRDTRRKPGIIGQGPVGAAKLLYGGAAICTNATGYLVPGADTAGLLFAGISRDRFDNSAGIDGALIAEFEKDGLHIMVLGFTATQADVGKKVFLSDDQTVVLEAAATNNIFCGILAEFVTAGIGYVDITPAVKKALVYALPVDITDPGDAGAISAALTGHCPITTADAETRTLADPADTGLRLSITLDVDGGNCVITAASAVNQTGNNTITMQDAGDTLILESVQVGGSNVWRVAVNDGCALTTV